MIIRITAPNSPVTIATIHTNKTKTVRDVVDVLIAVARRLGVSPKALGVYWCVALVLVLAVPGVGNARGHGGGSSHHVRMHTGK